MNPPSDVGIVPEHHQANGDGTVTDVGPLMPPPQQLPPQQGNNPYLPQQPNQGPGGYPMTGAPGYGNEPGMQQPPMPQQQQFPQMMPNNNNGYGAPAQSGYNGYGVGAGGFNNNQPSGGYRQQGAGGMFMNPANNNNYQPPQQYNGQQMLPANYGPAYPSGGYGMGSPAGVHHHHLQAAT